MLAPLRTSVRPLDARGLVGPLLSAAAGLDPREATAWATLRSDARSTLGALIEAGHLPGHLAVGPEDPPVVVARTLATAWRLVSRRARPE